jgi:phosphatidate cytidylyltransferase
MNLDTTTLGVMGGLMAALTLATGAGQLLKRQTDMGLNPALIEQFNLRIRAWWLLTAVLLAGFLLGQTTTVVLFGLLSFWALREFITLTPTRHADHRALFWVFLIFTPLQYVLVARANYDLFAILIPVYAFLFIPARVALAGDYKRYLERCAKIQAGTMICVYCLSYAPALLTSLDIPNDPLHRRNESLLLYFVIVVALNDAFQYLCEKWLGRRQIAPSISANKTWEGALAGMGFATLCGAALWWFTPFNPWLAAVMSLTICIMGFAGAMTMSAIKRDRGVKDYGTLVEGHGGILDRIDSVCFAAPVFFHLTRFAFMEFPELFPPV